MKHYLIGAAAAALIGTGALAQTADPSHNPAIKSGEAVRVTAAAHGRNSFTEDQAQGRIAKAGYTDVSKLTKDKNGVWRGTAMRAGAQVKVGLDYKGDVTTR